MTLLDACEPLFQRLCELNQAARLGRATPDFPTLRREVAGLLDATRNAILGDPALERHWAELEMPLLFFVDSFLAESSLPAAAEWNQKRLAYDHKELAGDQKFFELLDATLANKSADASARLGVFYTCVGLGFTGWNAGRPEVLRAKMAEMIRRVDPGVRTDGHLRLSPEAYDALDTRDLIQPPPISGVVMAWLFVGLGLTFLAIDLYLYQQSSGELRAVLHDLVSRGVERGSFHLRLGL